MITESIFGSSGPKFAYDLGGPSEATVILGHWVPGKNEQDGEKVLIHESELESDRDFIDLGGGYWVYDGFVYLMKYVDPILIRSKFEEINQYNRKKVVLWQHRDGDPFKDSLGNNMLFYMNCYPRNFGTLDYRDLLYIQFRSCKAVDFSNGSTIITQPAEIIITDSFKTDI